MISLPRSAASFILGALAWAVIAAADFADPPKGVKDLIPHRKHMSLKGRVVGVLLADGQPVLSTEGRSGPPDQLCFSTAGCSYRWVYVPVASNPQITNLQVPVGENGLMQIYPSLDLARTQN